jgi:hypothetical protein
MEKVFARGLRTKEELKQCIIEEFNKIPQDMIAKACRSVPMRLELCQDIEGRQIKLHKR